MRAVLVFFLVYRMYFVSIAVYMCPNVKDILTLGYMVKELLRAG